jgi:SAM-dependent methyltransferase
MDSISTSEAYLRDYHRRHPGTTARSFAEAAAEADGRSWRSSYAWLAERVPNTGSPTNVLDLGCGDGELLSLLAARDQAGLTLTGIDLSPAELAVAAERLGGRARLIEARAQALPLPPASVDIVLSHLALMLMDDVEAVVESIRRVLKPGGELACIVWGRMIQGDAFELLARTIREAILGEGVTGHRMGDARTATPEGLSALFGAGFAAVEVADLTIRRRATPESIWDGLFPNYDLDLLSPSGQEALRAAFLTKSASLVDGNGIIDCSIGLRSLTARRL